MICIWMLKVCEKPICRPLELIFNECISIDIRMKERLRSAYLLEKLYATRDNV